MWNFGVKRCTAKQVLLYRRWDCKFYGVHPRAALKQRCFIGYITRMAFLLLRQIAFNKGVYLPPVFEGNSDELYAHTCRRLVRGLFCPCHPAGNIHNLQIMRKADAQCKFGIDRQYGVGLDKDTFAADVHYIAAQQVSGAAERNSYAGFYS